MESNLLLALGQEFSLLDAIREDEERNEGKDTSWQAFNEEENSAD